MATGKVDMKIVMLGKEYVGKTCLAQRYLNERFSESGNYMATIGAAFGAKRLIVDGKPIVMGIWDTAGSERYEAMSRIYYRGAKAAIVCYDITDSASFERVKFWVDELRKNEMDCKIYLCGTKKDLIDESPKQRQVDVHDATDFADEYNARLFETSSKTGENIAGLFNLIAQQYAEDSKIAPNPAERSTISLRDDGQPQKSCRC